MSDVVIRVENLTKEYRLGVINHGTLRQDLQSWWARSRGKEDPNSIILSGANSAKLSDHPHMLALNDVSFDVPEGEILGIIGRNGAGKSTLLKILSRVTAPTRGSVKIKGRVASLLEVGTGFHPELSGRENIYLNGAILGMTKKEIKSKYDEIVDFAEIEKFIDTPVKRYSSGMYVRLAFAVAAHLEPEILIVDEVLAVGDVAFQKKCLGKMGDVAKGGRTVLFVSHNMGAVGRLCAKALWLNSGKLEATGNSQEMIEQYLANTYDKVSFRKFPLQENKNGQIKSVRLLNDQRVETTEFTSKTEPVVELSFVLRKKVTGCHVACIVSRIDGYHVFSTADTDTNKALFGVRLPGEYVAQVKLPTSNLNVGVYQISVGLGIPGVESFDRQEAISFTIHDAGDFGTLKEGSRRAGLLVVEAPWHYLSNQYET